MNNRLKIRWNKVVMDYFKGLSWHPPGVSDENHRKPIRIAGLQTEILKQLCSAGTQRLITAFTTARQ
jgi:hypothetical protein